ncbi:ABC transporter permease [Microbacterium sp.]|uniref:ABC transporter permease n=1 Tax=Microbacterium sp. TaxID=51671 RepID=UPI0039E5F9CD
MMTALTIERRKSKKAWILLLVAVALVGLNAANGINNYLSNVDTFAAQNVTWQAVWGQAALLWGALFFPFLITMRAASLTRMEHEQGNWRRMASYGAAVSKTYRGKLGLMCGFVLFCEAVFLAVVLASCLILGFSLTPGDIGTMFGWTLLGALGGVTIAAIQLLVGIIVRSFASTIVIGLGASILSLAITVVAPALGAIYPYALVVTGLQARTLTSPNIVELAMFLVWNAVLIFVAVIVGRLVLRKKEY